MYKSPLFVCGPSMDNHGSGHDNWAGDYGSHIRGSDDPGVLEEVGSSKLQTWYGIYDKLHSQLFYW